MQALHIPSHKDKPLIVRMSYGSNVFDSFQVPYAPDLSWYQEIDTTDGESSDFTVPTSSSNLNKKDFISSRNNLLTKSFDVDTLNIKGFIRVRIMAETFPKYVELARLDLPIFNVLDCTCDISPDSYLRWFPLLKSEECVPAEGEMGNFEQSTMTEQMDPSVFGYYRPCIRLKLRWLPADSGNVGKQDASNVSAAKGSKVYARFQIPSVSMSLIDSDRRREVLQMCISGTEVRFFENDLFTEYLVNVSSVQVV